MVRYLNMYRDQARELGYEPAGDQLGWAAPIYVAEPMNGRLRRRGEARNRSTKYLANPWEMLMRPATLSFPR